MRPSICGVPPQLALRTATFTGVSAFPRRITFASRSMMNRSPALAGIVSTSPSTSISPCASSTLPGLLTKQPRTIESPTVTVVSPLQIEPLKPCDCPIGTNPEFACTVVGASSPVPGFGSGFGLGSGFEFGSTPVAVRVVSVAVDDSV